MVTVINAVKDRQNFPRPVLNEEGGHCAVYAQYDSLIASCSICFKFHWLVVSMPRMNQVRLQHYYRRKGGRNAPSSRASRRECSSSSFKLETSVAGGTCQGEPDRDLDQVRNKPPL